MSKWTDHLRWTLTALLIIFIAFKAAGVIDWSWWLVLSPLLAPIAFFVLATIIAAIVIGVLWIRDRHTTRKPTRKGARR